jgi:hypothetical protein
MLLIMHRYLLLKYNVINKIICNRNYQDYIVIFIRIVLVAAAVVVIILFFLFHSLEARLLSLQKNGRINGTVNSIQYSVVRN